VEPSVYGRKYFEQKAGAGVFESLSSSFQNAISKIRFKDDEKALKRALGELKKSLLKADVHHKVLKELLSVVERETKLSGIGKENFLKALKKELTQILTAPGKQGFVYSSTPPTVVMMAGLQGSGKTTTSGKLAYYLAGRLAIDEELMDEIKRVKEVLDPDEIFYVADSLTGQDAVRSAAAFNKELGLTGVILSKYDGDSKGGVALGIAKQVGVPLRFIGSGEKMPDLELFIPDRIVNRLMGAGDIESLAEKASAVIDEKEAKRVARKIKKGQFNFNDFLEQLEQMKKLGSLKSIVGMIPGMGKMANALKDMDLENSGEIKKIKALISSMTPAERENPDLLNNSRKRRIAKGAGLNQMEVNKVLKQFKNAAKMAKKFSGKSPGTLT